MESKIMNTKTVTIDGTSLPLPKPKGELISLFSTPVVKINIGRSFTKDEIDCIANIPIERNEKKGMKNHRSKDFFLFDNYSETLKDIKIFCEDELERYLEEIEGADIDRATLRITQSWLNNTKPGESHHSHSHRNSYLSGVFYLKCLPNDSINFTNRSKGSYHNMEFSKERVTEWNSNGVIANVKKGDLILFPSWVPHHVDINETKDNERISLSFNTFPIGEMGEYDGATLLKL